MASAWIGLWLALGHFVRGYALPDQNPALEAACLLGIPPRGDPHKSTQIAAFRLENPFRMRLRIEGRPQALLA